MKIVIVGNGKVGNNLAGQLSKEEHDVVVIDKSLESIKKSDGEYDIFWIEGNGASFQTQKEAGVAEADLLIAVTSLDELNILCCIIAKKIGAKNTIARIRNPEYSEQLFHLEKDLGLSMSINPELTSAMEISRILRHPYASKIDTFGMGKIELVEIRVTHDNPVIDTKIKDLKLKEIKNYLICAVERDGDVFIPTGEFQILEHDRIHVAVEAHRLNQLFKLMNKPVQKIKKVMIIGGGRIAYYLTKQLIKTGMAITIIEKEEKRCKFLCAEFPEAIIIHGDGSDENLLIQEGIEDADAFVALTDMDEENIIMSMYVAHITKSKVISKINRLNYLKAFAETSLDTIISPKLLTSEDIVKYVRAMSNAEGSKVRTLYKIANDKAEVLEFIADGSTRYLETPINKIPIKRNILVVGITRKNKIVIPKGDNVIKEGDIVMLVTKNEALYDLNDIFFK